MSSFRERPFPVRAAVRLRSVRGAAVPAGGIVAACPASGDRVERTPLRGVIFPDEASQPPSRPDAARVFAVGSVSAQLPRLGFALSSRMKLRSRHLAPVPHDPPCAQHRRGAAFGIPGLSEAVFGSGRRVSTCPVACAVSPSLELERGRRDRVRPDRTGSASETKPASYVCSPQNTR